MPELFFIHHKIISNIHFSCKRVLHLANLPAVSIILPFFNEYFSVLIRSLYSIVNRTPKKLLHEIIIVDDGSDRSYLKQHLENYVEKNFGSLVRIVRLSQRSGLIAARLAGAKVASGEVLIFFDSHIECTHNWLPPLLQPIVINPNISTCPMIDVIGHKDFAYSLHVPKGFRGGFDWHLKFDYMPLRKGEDIYPLKPHANPVMIGGLFAIGRKFFWMLGGYDDGLEIWGAEQYELSFKIWMCGGVLLNVPCSRVGHIFRGPRHDMPNPKNYSYLERVSSENYAKRGQIYKPKFYKPES